MRTVFITIAIATILGACHFLTRDTGTMKESVPTAAGAGRAYFQNPTPQLIPPTHPANPSPSLTASQFSAPSQSVASPSRSADIDLAACTIGRVSSLPGDYFWGRVMHISDGDTFTMAHVRQDSSLAPSPAPAMGEQVRVRLWGIDAPETAQMGGQESAGLLYSLLEEGSAVLIRRLDVDRYGRWVAVVAAYPMEPAVNVQMVASGNAYHYERYAPDSSCLAEAQVAAERADIGVWAQYQPERPWDYRARTR